jgi:hypothetical protein
MLAQTGAGRHTYESTYEEYNLYFYYLSVCRIIFYVSVGLIKISITLFIRRLADRASKKWRLFADIFLGTVVIYILLAIFCKLDLGAGVVEVLRLLTLQRVRVHMQSHSVCVG